MSGERQFKTLAEFYPYYLGQHRNRRCRQLHFIGTAMALCLLLSVALGAAWYWLAVAVVQGYIWAWLGHFVFEKNRPATFRYPLYSFCCDWLMFRDICLRRLP